MTLRDKLVGSGAGLALGLAGILGSQASAASVVKIETHLPQTNLLADGSTVYEMDVRANTADDFPTTKFNDAEWDVVVPGYFTILSGTTPNGTNNSSGPSAVSSDFFYNFVMDSGFNRADSSVSGGELTDNVRLTNNPNDGPSNRSYSNGWLGKYTFTVNTDAPLVNGNFDLNDVFFGDTNFNVYYSPDNGDGVSVFNDTYTITAPQSEVPLPSTGLLVGAGLLGLAAGRGRRMYGSRGRGNDGMYEGTLGEQDLGSSGRRERPVIKN